MKLDINETLAGMLAAIKTSVGNDWPQVKSAMNDFLQSRKARLELLADFRINGIITGDEFNSRMEDEKLLLKSELHVIAIISKSMAQKAANAALDVLEQAVKALIPF